MNEKQSDDPNIVRSIALIEATRRHAEDLWQEILRSKQLLKEARKLLDATPPRRNPPDAS